MIFFLVFVGCFGNVQSVGWDLLSGDPRLRYIPGDPSWNYIPGDPLGPENWGHYFPDCVGISQSPINVDTATLIYDERLTQDQFKLFGYDRTDRTTYLTNTGHTVGISFAGPPSHLNGGCLSGQYTLANLHFHWGRTDFFGSEHYINGRPFPLEMHMVHISDIHNVSSSVGVAVLAFLFEIGEEDNKEFDGILNYFDQIKFKGYEVIIPSFDIESLIAIDLEKYFRYPGSFTTPGCHESVIWTVFSDPLFISSNQMKKFRQIMEGRPWDPPRNLVDNCRPTQPLNGRPVYTSIS